MLARLHNTFEVSREVRREQPIRPVSVDRALALSIIMSLDGVQHNLDGRKSAVDVDIDITRERRTTCNRKNSSLFVKLYTNSQSV